MATKPPPPKGSAGEARLPAEAGKKAASRSTSGVASSKPAPAAKPTSPPAPSGAKGPASAAKAKAQPNTTAHPKTKITPWPPSGSKRKKKIKVPPWTVPLVLIGCIGALAWVKFGPKPRDPILLVVGGGVEEVGGNLTLIASDLDRLGAAGQVIEQITVTGGKYDLDAKRLRGFLERSGGGAALLRARRAGPGGTFRTLITVIDAAAEVEPGLLVESAETPNARTIVEARPLRFTSGTRGGFEVVPAGAGPVFLDASCPPPELVPPGEWFLLYRDGAPASKTVLDASSDSACIDACEASEDECYECKLDQANLRTASRISQAQEGARRNEATIALSQSFSIRADATRFQLTAVDERCYGLIPRHGAELMGAFIVPLEPRRLVLETPEGERSLR